MHGRMINLGAVLVAILSLSLLAAEKHSGHTPGMNHDVSEAENTQPEEGGQAAFAALIEIVAILEQDPETDWSNVDIDSLRSHLVDMNHLIINTNATKVVVDETTIRFDIRGTATSIPAIHRMIPAHSRFVTQSRGWIITPDLNDVGALLTITVDDVATLDRLNALGFYGFMSLDSHHQAHHYQMAIGHAH